MIQDINGPLNKKMQKKPLVFIITLSIALSPLLSFADTSTSTSSGSIAQPSSNSQAGSLGGNTQNGGTQSGINQALTSIGGCAVSGMVNSAIKDAMSSVGSSLGGSSGSSQTVPIRNDIQDPKVTTASKAHEGNLTIGGVNLGISWDGLGYCVANAAIKYIKSATMNMINTGFNGNPAFVQNPQQFFNDISNVEANQFVNSLNTSSISPALQGVVAKNLVSDYNSNFNGSQANTWTPAQTQSYDSFVSGSPSGFSLTNLFNVSQNPSNNFYGSQMMAQNQMQSQIAGKVGLQAEQLSWNGGWLSAQNCQTVNGQQVCNVVTPGSSISAASNNTQNLSNLRLASQSKFDQIIQSLVQEMVKTGLNKLMQSSGSR